MLTGASSVTSCRRTYSQPYYTSPPVQAGRAVIWCTSGGYPAVLQSPRKQAVPCWLQQACVCQSSAPTCRSPHRQMDHSLASHPCTTKQQKGSVAQAAVQWLCMPSTTAAPIAQSQDAGHVGRQHLLRHSSDPTPVLTRGVGATASESQAGAHCWACLVSAAACVALPYNV